MATGQQTTGALVGSPVSGSVVKKVPIKFTCTITNASTDTNTWLLRATPMVSGMPCLISQVVIDSQGAGAGAADVLSSASAVAQPQGACVRKKTDSGSLDTIQDGTDWREAQAEPSSPLCGSDGVPCTLIASSGGTAVVRFSVIPLCATTAASGMSVDCMFEFVEDNGLTQVYAKKCAAAITYTVTNS